MKNCIIAIFVIILLGNSGLLLADEIKHYPITTVWSQSSTGSYMKGEKSNMPPPITREQFMEMVKEKEKKEFEKQLTNLIPCIIAIESSGDPHAIGKAGEIGLMQISPITYREWKIYYIEYIDFYDNSNLNHPLNRVQENLIDPKFNKLVGTWYLKRLRDHYLKEHYTLETLLASYNWGIGNVRKVDYDYERFPNSVKRYIQKVIKLYNKTK